MTSSSSSANSRAIVMELARLFAMFPVHGQSEEGQKLRLAGYVDVIGGFPIWAVQVVCAKVCRGLYPEINRAFAPSPADLAELLREHIASVPRAAKDGSISFDGEVPMTWIPEADPRWDDLCAMAKAGDPKSKPYPMTSKYAAGRGAFFRTEFVAKLPAPLAMLRAGTQSEEFGRVSDGLTRLAEAMANTPPSTLPKASTLRPGTRVVWEQVDVLPVKSRFLDDKRAERRKTSTAGDGPNARALREQAPELQQPPAAAE